MSIFVEEKELNDNETNHNENREMIDIPKSFVTKNQQQNVELIKSNNLFGKISLYRLKFPSFTRVNKTSISPSIVNKKKRKRKKRKRSSLVHPSSNKNVMKRDYSSKRKFFERIKNNLAGLVLVLMMITVIVGEGEITQITFAHYDFNNYFLLSFTSILALMFTYPMYLSSVKSGKMVQFLFNLFFRRRDKIMLKNKKEPANEQTSLLTNYSSTILPYESTDDDSFLLNGLDIGVNSSIELSSDESVESITYKKLVLYAFLFGPIQLATNVLWVFSLRFISLAMNLALCDIEIVFVFLLSLIILKERPKFYKIATLVACLLGVSLLFCSALWITTDRSPSGNNEKMLGIFLVIASAFCHALFDVLFSRFIGDQSLAIISLFQSLCAIANLIYFWPIVLVLHFVSVEPLDSLDGLGIAFLSVNGLLTIAYYGLDMVAISYTSPFYVSLSAMGAVPLSWLIDFAVGYQKFDTLSFAGMLLIFCSSSFLNFCTFALPEDDKDHH
jgi:drug/metabolite transporter (DMT)-like permease